MALAESYNLSSAFTTLLPGLMIGYTASVPSTTAPATTPEVTFFAMLNIESPNL